MAAYFSTLAKALYYWYNPIDYTLPLPRFIVQELSSTGRNISDSTAYFLEYLRRNPTIDLDAVDEDEMTALHYAVSFQFSKVVWTLIDQGANCNKANADGMTPLIQALVAPGREDKRYEIAKILCLHGRADPKLHDIRGNTPLHFAAARDQLEIVRLLCECGADVDAKNEEEALPLGLSTPLVLAAMNGHLEVMQYLHVGREASLCNAGRVPILKLAASTPRSNLGSCNLLCQWGVNVNGVDKNGVTALMAAVNRGHGDIVRALCENWHANVNQQERDGQTALHFAVSAGDPEMCSLLCDFGAGLDATQNFNPIELAAIIGNFGIVKQLGIHFQADVVVTDEMWRKALTYNDRQSVSQHYEIVNFVTTELPKLRKGAFIIWSILQERESSFVRRLPECVKERVGMDLV